MSSTDKSPNPIVLIGCSGAGDEIPRLASILVSSQSSSLQSKASAALLQTTSPNNNDSTSEEGGGVVDVIHIDPKGHFVLTPSDMQNLLRGDHSQTLTSKDVIVLDYSHPMFRLEEQKYKQQLIAAYNALAESLYRNCTCVYVNVKPKPSLMHPTSIKIQSDLERDVFLKFSNYELAINDEGLDPTTRLARESLDSSIEERPSQTFESTVQHLTQREYDDLRTDWEHVNWELLRIVARSRLLRPTPKSRDAQIRLGGRDTFFLSLSFPSIDMVEPYVKDLCEENDAMEFRADLLTCRSDRFDVLCSLQTLRKYCRPHATRAPCLPLGSTIMDDVVPVVYTVRTKRQAGTWPDETSRDIEDMFELLRLGLRHGVEILDVESAWDKTLTNELLEHSERYSGLILGSHHLLTKTDLDTAVELYKACALDGRAHGAKLVLSIDDKKDDRMAMDASIRSDLAIPTISLVLGPQGQYSRIINRSMTPTTHPALPFKAAPGQLSAKEIIERRIKDGLLRKRTFSVSGNGDGIVAEMHREAFRVCGLPHEVVLRDVDDSLERFVQEELRGSDAFGGASVAAPDQTAVLAYMDDVSDAAKVIGAANTIAITNIERENVLCGENTDWIGVYRPLQRRLKSDVSGHVLIWGAGEMAPAAAYAVKQLGFDRLYYDDAPSKANQLADTFGGEVLPELSPEQLERLLQDPQRLKAIVFTLSASSTDAELPPWILRSKPIVFDTNHKPYYTKVSFQAEKSGCEVVRGSEMLLESGAVQFELWMDRTAPYKVMKDVVWRSCSPERDESLEEGEREAEVVKEED